MHGYQIITKIRKNFGVYFGPSTVYPLLSTLEKKGFVKSEWNMNAERPRKIYSLTSNGQNMLNFTADSLNLICRKIAIQTNTEINPEPSTHSALNITAKSYSATSTNWLSFRNANALFCPEITKVYVLVRVPYFFEKRPSLRWIQAGQDEHETLETLFRPPRNPLWVFKALSLWEWRAFAA